MVFLNSNERLQTVSWQWDCRSSDWSYTKKDKISGMFYFYLFILQQFKSSACLSQVDIFLHLKITLQEKEVLNNLHNESSTIEPNFLENQADHLDDTKNL